MERILGVARMIGSVQIECGMREAVEDFVETLKFGLVEVVYEWAKGTSFKDITCLTTVQEGKGKNHWKYLTTCSTKTYFIVLPFCNVFS